MKIKQLIKKGVQLYKKNNSAILTGISIVGMAATAIAAYKVRPKVDEALQNRKEYIDTMVENLNKELQEGVIKNDEYENVLKQTKKEINKQAAKKIVPAVLPVILMGASSAACSIGSLKASSKKVAVLSTAYAASEATVRELTAKTEELLGAEKAKEIKEAVTKDKLEKKIKEHGGNIQNAGQTVFVESDKKVPCFDDYTGYIFDVNPQKLKEGIIKASEICRQQNEVSINELYQECDIRVKNQVGNDFGWTIDQISKNNGIIPVHLTSIVHNDIPHLCITYTIQPKPLI